MWKKRKEIKDEDRVIKDPERSRKKTFDRAVNLLTYKPRSITELRERLLEKPWTDHQIVEEVIEKLKKYNYLNDEQFAKDFAASKLRQKAVGKKRLRMDLIKKKLDRETIERALEETFDETSEGELIDRAIAKRLRIKGRPEDQSDRKKFFDHLMRLGFSYDTVRDKMREVMSGDFDQDGDR
ncbi:MAG: RecX family transcriptional regulator [Pyrinomonadaceae bacterium]